MFDLPPDPPKFWLPAKPAIIRVAPDLKQGMLPGLLPVPVRRPGAITFVGGIAGAVADGGDVTLTLSGLGLAQNDVVIVFGGFSRTTADPGVSSGGWTENFEFDGADQDNSLSWKAMSGSPDTSVVCLGSANATDAAAYVALAFRGVNTTTPFDATSVTGEGAAGAIPNPPSITTATAGAMIIAMGAVRFSPPDTTVTEPSGYAAMTSGVHYAGADDGRAQVCAMTYLLAGAAGAYNPGAFSNWTVDGARAHGQHTAALRPA